jgi:hypothetical protein
MTALQVARAIAFAHPESSPAKRYLSLVQHNSYWFGKIIDRGYETTVPPIDHKEMEVSNVAFFPAYPLLGGLVKRATGLGTHLSLLIVVQVAASGFWTYFFLFCQRWRLSLPLQVFGALAIAVHPAASYLVAGHSESLSSWHSPGSFIGAPGKAGRRISRLFCTGASYPPCGLA